MDDEDNIIVRKENQHLKVPFVCEYPGKKYGYKLLKNLKVNVMVKVIRPSTDPIDNYFSFLELNEKQIKYWYDPKNNPINP